jgi:hypothetical protein
MWQDPIAVVDRAAHIPNANHFIPLQVGIAGHLNQFVKRCEDAPQTQILLVMVPNGMYAEQIESRLRMRHAVVSALSVAGYRPEDEEHIGALQWSLEKQIPDTFLPFEWFRRRINVSLNSAGVARLSFGFPIHSLRRIPSSTSIVWLKT